MATDFSNSGAFNVNGQWATTIRFEATRETNAVTQVQLRFFNGRSEVAQAQLSGEEARALLGESNYAIIEGAAGSEGSAKGELRGKALAFRQITLPGHSAAPEENVISLARRARGTEEWAADVTATPSAAPRTEDAQDAAATLPLGDKGDAVSSDSIESDLDEEMHRRVARARAIPESVAERFRRVRDSYYFADQTLAFIDQGNRLKSMSNNLEVVRSLVAIAEARGWEAIRVGGVPEFRREIWREASLAGIQVQEYEPTDAERHALRIAMEKRHGQNEIRRQAPQRDAARIDSSPGSVGAEAGEPNGPRRAAPARPGQSERPDPRADLLIGRLLDFGAAPFRFDPGQGLSYYVKLRTEAGERVIWGTDLERAIVESETQVKVGDTVAIENRGSMPVVVKAAQRDASGRIVGDKMVATNRKRWAIERASYFDERAEKAEAFRSGEAAKRELAQQYPDLTGAVVTLWMGEQFAAKRIERPEDRERVVALVKERLADALSRGEAIDSPRLKEDVARRLDAIADDFDEIGQRARARTRREARRPREQMREEPPQVHM